MSFLFTPFFEDFSAALPFLLHQVNNQLVHDFLSQQQNNRLFFLSELMDFRWSNTAALSVVAMTEASHTHTS
jgi:hypothetical protein